MTIRYGTAYAVSAKILGGTPRPFRGVSRTSRRKVALAGAIVLFALNAWICHRLFTAEFLGFQSNEAAFISLGRIYRDHWRDLAWFPFFDCGMPIENAYQPLLPALTALVSGLTAISIGRAFHLVMALAYCLGPVTLSWLAWEWSESLGTSLLAGLFYSLISPSAMLFPAVRAVSGNIWVAQRLFNIVFYGEDPHNLALTLLPVALVFLRRLALRRDRWSFLGAVVSCAAVVMTNAFGAMSVALGALCTVLALQSGFGVVALAGVVAWCWISPWISPSLLGKIQSIALTQRGQYQSGLKAEVAAGVVLLMFILIRALTRRLASPFERFVCLFLPWMCAFPVAFYAAGITLVPQPHRYQLELELVVCLLLAALCARAMRGGFILRAAAAIALSVLFIHQVLAYRNFAHALIRPVEITQTAEYRLAKWIDANLPRERVMVSGDAAWLFNVFSDHPQMSGGHDASTPNFIQQVAVYQLYTGMNAGERDAEVSLFWLKAFGAQAVTVPAGNSAEVYKPYVNAAKFRNVLPVLWRDGPDAVYEVPQRSASLARVIPAAAIVERQPVHGLDLEPARAYVAALDDPAMPQPELRWDGLSKASFHAVMAPDQAVSIQLNYDKGWRASVRGQRRPVKKDGLGLMVVEPNCSGSCDVELEFAPTTETWICRLLSAVASLVLLVVASRPIRRSGGSVLPAAPPGTISAGERDRQLCESRPADAGAAAIQ